MLDVLINCYTYHFILYIVQVWSFMKRIANSRCCLIIESKRRVAPEKQSYNCIHVYQTMLHPDYSLPHVSYINRISANMHILYENYVDYWLYIWVQRNQGTKNNIIVQNLM